MSEELVFEWEDVPECRNGYGRQLKRIAPTSWSGKVVLYLEPNVTSPTACFNNKYLATMTHNPSASHNEKPFHGLFDSMIEGQMFVERHMIGVLEFERAAARARLAGYDEALKKHDNRKDGAK